MSVSPCSLSSAPPPATPILQVDWRVLHILRTLDRDLARDLPELARNVNLSVSRLSHLFKRDTDCSLQTFLVDCRLKKAAELLRGGKTPIKEISYSVGYRHPSSFIRIFRKKFHCSPGEYRGRCRSQTVGS